jgi:hypothetical protein
MNPVEQYLADIGAARATQAGTAETSYYPALVTLLNEIGRTLNPKVRCVIQLQNRGAGLPDGGLFTADQFKRKAVSEEAAANPLLVLPPARGVIEIKAPGEDLQTTLESEQVARYWKHYGLVLVTNYRAFALVGRNGSGEPAVLERFTLADTETAFWKLTVHPRAANDALGARFTEYLRRVMLHNAPLASPQDVAALLASYARDAKARIEHADLPALAGLRGALEQALGLRFEGEKGEHFFRSTLIQTLFYGVFSAWVLWARHNRAVPATKDQSFKQALREASATYTTDPKHFDWHSAAWCLRVPMIRALFEQIATPARLGPLGLTEVLDWTGAALNRVDLTAFFAAFDEGHAVQYFYEPFLEAFDPELRKELGVWYTPTEIVNYQVERVDTVLRDELNIPDGLADPRVVVLDPCCGTGAYVCAVLIRIAKTLADRGGDALVANDLKRAAIERVFGFEILPAPFVVAHLQISLLLETLGAPLNDATEERVGVYLTNALTGWEPLKEPKTQVLFPEMEEERDAANHVKQSQRILVILGNPPYNGYAGIAMDEERDLSDAYRTTRRAPAPQGQGLNDLYIRFFRMAERRIVDMNQPAQGVICFISNYSWLDGLSFTGMRERYLEAFDRIWIDCLNGDKYKTGKVTPDGLPDPSVFSTEFNREGIQVGTAIATLVRKAAHTPADAIAFRHLWGQTKRADLLAGPGEYETLTPELGVGLSLMPGQVSAAYLSWPLLPQLFPVSFPGVKTSRDEVVVDVDRDELVKRMEEYFDPEISHEEMRRLAPQVMASTQRFSAETVRDQLRKRGFKPECVVRYCYRPFDVRWLYWEPETKLLDEKRTEYFAHAGDGNVWMVAQQKPRRDWSVPQFIYPLGCLDLMDRGASCFPLHLHLDGSSLLEPAGHKPNLSEAAVSYLAGLQAAPEDLFYHVLAVLHASAYRMENAGALRQDWPRVPLPGGDCSGPGATPSGIGGQRSARRTEFTDVLATSAALGRQVAALLDTETPVPGVTTGRIRDDLKTVAVFSRVDGKPAKPEAGDLDLTAGWGHGGKGGVTMPGRGKVQRSEGDSQRSDRACFDIFLNDDCCWRNVPEPVWEYTIGGYQVIKKWLSYREKPLLGRSLTVDEVRYVTEMARRLAALIALQPALDANYKAVAATTAALCAAK